LPDAPGLSAPDVALALDAAPAWRRPSPDGAPVRYRTPASESQPNDNLVVHEFAEGFLMRYADGTEFHVSRDGHRVWGTWPRESTLADTETYLLGPVLGFAQRLMGVLCLHASAVVVDGAAVALCGPAGSGKSTTAGAFAAAGYGVMADDMTAIRMDGDTPFALPAYDHLRLWEDGERILLGRSGRLPQLTPTWDKRVLRLRGQGWRFHESPAPLAAVCLLAPREGAARAPRTETPMPGDAFVAIAANSYANYLLDARMRREEFTSITALLTGVRVLRVIPPGDPSRIGALVEAIVGAVRA
jgi:hypothetical protein